jgi:hypothetical protein
MLMLISDPLLMSLYLLKVVSLDFGCKLLLRVSRDLVDPLFSLSYLQFLFFLVDDSMVLILKIS